MKKRNRIVAGLMAVCLTFGLLTACQKTEAKADGKDNKADSASEQKTQGEADSSLKGERVRVVIGSTSTSGDSYMMADLVTRYLSEEMGFNGKVDAIGNANALKEISKAKGDGTTVMMFHDMIFMSVLFGAVDEKYALENLTVGSRIGQNPGACFGARADAPYNNLKEMCEWLKANPDKKVRVNIEAGGTSHIGFVGFWLWAQEHYSNAVSDRIRVLVGGTTAEKLQTLWDGNSDVTFGDYSTFVQYTEEGVDDQLKLKIMDPLDKIEGVDIPTMADNGVTFKDKPFVFSKDFCMYFPKDMDADVLAEYEAAMHRVASNPQFKEDLNKLKYKVVDMGVADSKDFMYEKRAVTKELIDKAPSLDDLTS